MDQDLKRTVFFYPADMLARLRAMSKHTGIPIVRIIRQAVEAWLKEHGA